MTWAAVPPIVVMTAAAVWIAWRMFSGWRTGLIMPLRYGPWTKGAYDRRTDPGMFWLTLAGHAFFLAFLLGFIVLATGLFDR